MELIKINRCEVCDHDNLVEVLDLGLHPLCDDLIPINSEEKSKEYPIVILYCDKCFTAHQKYQVPKQTLFPKEYHYRSRFTLDVLQGMKQLVETVQTNLGDLQNKIVLDVGCNDGSLLNFFKEKGCLTYGVDPTNAVKDADTSKHKVFQSYFDEEFVSTFVENHLRPDIITFTNVFAHIEDLDALINSLNSLSKKETIIVIENHYLGSVLEKNQFDTFYHEHPRTYSLQSFEFIAAKLGKKLSHVEFPSRYGGNIRVIISEKEGLQNIDEFKVKEQRFKTDFYNLKDKINLWRLKKNQVIAELTSSGHKLIAKAFPGRAAILVKLLELNENQIEFVSEKPKSIKIGHYVPGTRIPILSDDLIFSNNYRNRTILNLAWHISSEIETYLRSNQFQGKIVNIIEHDDFI